MGLVVAPAGANAFNHVNKQFEKETYFPVSVFLLMCTYNLCRVCVCVCVFGLRRSCGEIALTAVLLVFNYQLLRPPHPGREGVGGRR